MVETGDQYCGGCGTKLRTSSAFCSTCGRAVDGEAAIGAPVPTMAGPATQTLIPPAATTPLPFSAAPPGTVALRASRLISGGIAGLGPLIVAGPVWYAFRLGLVPGLLFPTTWDTPPAGFINSYSRGTLYLFSNLLGGYSSRSFVGDAIWIAAITGIAVAFLSFIAVTSYKDGSSVRTVPTGLATAITVLRLITATLTALAAAWCVLAMATASYIEASELLKALWLPMVLIGIATVLYLPIKARPPRAQLQFGGTVPLGTVGQPNTAWGAAPPVTTYSQAGQYAGYNPMPVARTNGLAISAMVCGIAGLVSCALTSILAIIFGHIALYQIKRSGGTQSGRGMAIAGLVLGYLVVALGIIALIWVVSIGHSSRY